MLRVVSPGGEFEIEVLQLSEVRGPASVAQTLYRETEASKELRRAFGCCLLTVPKEVEARLREHLRHDEIAGAG